MPGVLVEVLPVPAEPVLAAAFIHVRHVCPQHVGPSGGAVRRRLPGASIPKAWDSALHITVQGQPGAARAEIVSLRTALRRLRARAHSEERGAQRRFIRRAYTCTGRLLELTPSTAAFARSMN